MFPKGYKRPQLSAAWRQRRKHRNEEYADVWAERAPQVRAIAHKYELAGLSEWNNARVAALARALGKSIYTLCAEAGMFQTLYDNQRDIFRLFLDKKRIGVFWNTSYWPVYLTVQWERLEQYLKVRNGESSAMLSTADLATAKDLAKKD